MRTNVAERSVGVGGGRGLSRLQDVGGRYIAGIPRFLGRKTSVNEPQSVENLEVTRCR